MTDPKQGMFTADIAAVAAQEWHAYIDPLAEIGEKIARRMQDPQDPQLRREMYRALFSQTATAYLGLLYADPRHPDFWPWFNIAFNNLGPNPDDVFSLTPIDDGGIYKLSGFRGTVRMIVVQMGTGTFITRGSLDDPIYSRTLANNNLDELHIDQDGSFEVVISAKRPHGHEGNWWELPKGSTYLFIRQISYDWLHEVDGRLAIERLDTPAVKPRPSAAELEANLKQVAIWVETNLQWSLDFMDSVRKEMGINDVRYKDVSEYGGMITQRTTYGAFDLEPDEALILETEVPEHCRYWSYHLFDNLFLSYDWMNRQTNLNGHTAKTSGGNKVHIVISSRDPGVPNWLDTAGYRTGFIAGRWKECNRWPDHKTIKVKTAEVRKYLPADTPVITAEERETAIRLRRKAVQLRRKW